MPVPAGEPLTPADHLRLERAVAVAERFSGLSFSIFVGLSEDDARLYAERLHAGLPDPDRSVLVMCDPALQALEIVTGAGTRRVLDDFDCRLAAASMQTSFAAGDIVGGLATGVQQLGQSARKPKTLHAARR